MITLHMTGAAAEYISNRDMIENPTTPDERAFAKFWSERTERVYGRGYRVTLHAPQWVFNWIADDFEEFLSIVQDEATPAERRGMRKFVADVHSAGIRDRADGPTREWLILNRYLPAETPTAETDVPPIVTTEEAIATAEAATGMSYATLERKSAGHLTNGRNLIFLTMHSEREADVWRALFKEIHGIVVAGAERFMSVWEEAPDGSTVADVAVQAVAAEHAAKAATQPVNAPAERPGDKYREEARRCRKQAAESYARCQEDGFLSQWAAGKMERAYEYAASVADDGYRIKVPALFDLEGNQVPAMLTEGTYGPVWRVQGAERWEYFRESKAHGEEAQKHSNAIRGYYVGWIKVPATIDQFGTVERAGNPYYCADAEVIDNGK